MDRKWREPLIVISGSFAFEHKTCVIASLPWRIAPSVGGSNFTMSLRGTVFVPKQSPIRRAGIASPSARNDRRVWHHLQGMGGTSLGQE
jgi:hypothetical protein